MNITKSVSFDGNWPALNMQKYQEMTENRRQELRLTAGVGSVGLECGSRVPDSGTQMSSTAGQLWTFAEISGWFAGTWLAGFGEAALWVLLGAESSEDGQLAPVGGQVGR